VSRLELDKRVTPLQEDVMGTVSGLRVLIHSTISREVTAEPVSLGWGMKTVDGVRTWRVDKKGVGAIHLVLLPGMLDTVTSCMRNMLVGNPSTAHREDQSGKRSIVSKGTVDIGPIVLVYAMVLGKRPVSVCKLTVQPQLLSSVSSPSSLHLECTLTLSLNIWNNTCFAWQRLTHLEQTAFELNIGDKGTQVSLANHRSTDVYWTPEVKQWVRNTVSKDEWHKEGQAMGQLNPLVDTAYIFVRNNSGLDIFAYLKIGECKSRKSRVANTTGKYITIDFVTNADEEVSKQLVVQFESSPHRSKIPAPCTIDLGAGPTPRAARLERHLAILSRSPDGLALQVEIAALRGLANRTDLCLDVLTGCETVSLPHPTDSKPAAEEIGNMVGSHIHAAAVKPSRSPEVFVPVLSSEIVLVLQHKYLSQSISLQELEARDNGYPVSIPTQENTMHFIVRKTVTNQITNFSVHSGFCIESHFPCKLHMRLFWKGHIISKSLSPLGSWPIYEIDPYTTPCELLLLSGDERYECQVALTDWLQGSGEKEMRVQMKDRNNGNSIYLNVVRDEHGIGIYSKMCVQCKFKAAPLSVIYRQKNFMKQEHSMRQIESNPGLFFAEHEGLYYIGISAESKTATSTEPTEEPTEPSPIAPKEKRANTCYYYIGQKEPQTQETLAIREKTRTLSYPIVIHSNMGKIGEKEAWNSVVIRAGMKVKNRTGKRVVLMQRGEEVVGVEGGGKAEVGTATKDFRFSLHIEGEEMR
jgi:hypothetical protein